MNFMESNSCVIEDAAPAPERLFRRERPDHRFSVGLLAGAMAGVWLAMWAAPRLISELRRRRDDIADSVVRRARDVERYATASKTDTAPDRHAL